MPSLAYGHFQKNLETVSRLQETFEDAKLVKSSRGKRGKGAFDHITRSAIVFLISAFEVYCEEIICECCEQYIKKAKDAEKLPHDVKKSINSYVKNESNHVPPTHLCDEGWRNVYRTLVKQRTDYLNTPNTKNLKELFQNLLGIKNEKLDSIECIDKLDEMIDFRGEITHRVKANKYVHIEEVEQYKNNITSIVIGMDKMMREQISAFFSVKVPWNDTYEPSKR